MMKFETMMRLEEMANGGTVAAGPIAPAMLKLDCKKEGACGHSLQVILFCSWWSAGG